MPEGGKEVRGDMIRNACLCDPYPPSLCLSPSLPASLPVALWWIQVGWKRIERKPKLLFFFCSMFIVATVHQLMAVIYRLIFGTVPCPLSPPCSLLSPPCSSLLTSSHAHVSCLCVYACM